jgi:solute carrier family 35 protein E2
LYLSQPLLVISAFIAGYSVANTAKRAFLIWLSVLLFGNPVTLLSGLGTCTVIVGVLLYNKAQEYDRLKLSKVGGHRKSVSVRWWACK